MVVVVDRNSMQRFVPEDTVHGTTSCRTDLNVKELTSLREGLHGMMQCDRRQHFAASNDLHEHPGRHAEWKESPRTKFMNIQMDSKMRSEPSEYMWKTTCAFVRSWRNK